MTARAFAAQATRDMMHQTDGHDYDHFSDAEMLDPTLYNCFPNISIWGGAAPNLVYRWRPNGRDVHSAIMDVYRLAPVPKHGPRPKPAPVHWLTDDEKWSDADELGGLGEIFNQDMGNLPYVQEGLLTSGNKRVEFGNYQEMRIRQHHIMLKKYMNDEI